MDLLKANGSTYSFPATTQETRLLRLAPRDEVYALLREAAASVEAELVLEDAGWINLSGQTGEVITSSERIANLKLSRLYAAKDPLGKQAIRLWTDYSFGTGMTWDTVDEPAKKILTAFWDTSGNQKLLSSIGQRVSSNKLLIDGEIFFAIFLGTQGQAKIRRIDPLEITEIVTDVDDVEETLYYRRQWTDVRGMPHDDYYRDATNAAGKPGISSDGATIISKEGPLVYHLTFNTEGQRGNPLLLPALPWMLYHTRQLSSYIAVDIAQSKFVLRQKVTGGQAAVNAIKAITENKEINAGSTIVENQGVDTTSFDVDKRAKNAYDGARLTKLQVCAAVGIPEQYFGDLATGNLATAKTVELPMMKMFQSYQQLWATADKDINTIVLTHGNVPPADQYVDINFPAIAPEDVLQAATAIVQILGVFPEFASSPDVQQQAMLTLGVNDPAEALEQIAKESKSNPEIALVKALKHFRESLKVKE